MSSTAPAGLELALGLVHGSAARTAGRRWRPAACSSRSSATAPWPATAGRGRRQALLDRLAVRPLLDGHRGGPAADLTSVLAAVTGLSQLAVELGDLITALDVNPLIAGPKGAVAVDVLIETAGLRPPRLNTRRDLEI